MAITLSPPLSTASSRLPFYLQDLYKYLGGFAVLTTIYIGLRLYQGAYAVATGLDSTLPEYEVYWMRLFYGELIALGSFTSVLWTYLWMTRDRNLGMLPPKVEIRRHFALTMWISIYTFAVYWAGSYFAEQDNS